MKLWILTAKESSHKWEPWYDKAFGHIVRAPSARVARFLASTRAGDEGAEAWLRPEHSTCAVLKMDGDAGHILRNFSAA